MTANMKTVSELTFGEVKKAKNGMPVLELLLDDTVAGYLSPSNLDGFKVTGSVEESATLKGCQRIDMKELANLPIGNNILQASATLVATNYAMKNSEYELSYLGLTALFALTDYVGTCAKWIRTQN